jgi:hypothetical protein
MEFLDWQILETMPEYLVDIPGAAHRNSVFAVFSSHPPAQLECRMNRNGPRISYPFERRKSRNWL